MKSLVKRIAASRVLTRLAAARTKQAILIICYHDVAADGQPTSWLRVPESAFDRQLALLSQIGKFVGPNALDSVGAPEGPLRLLLTFDDGYVNNYRLALPILQKHAAPALFFISTWHTQTQEPFWFDRVVTPIQAEWLTELDLRDAGLGLYRFHPQDGQRRWNDIQRLLRDMKALGNPEEDKVRHVLTCCTAAGGQSTARALADCRPLTASELLAMADSGICHFGSHSHRHEILPLLDDAELADALARSRSFLEEVLGLPVVDIAYPNGDVDARVVARARGAGFRRGYTTRPAAASVADDLLLMPRVLVGGYDSSTILSWKVNKALFAGARTG